MAVKDICLVAQGMGGPSPSLQPWRYLWGIAEGLAAAGLNVTILTDGAEEGDGERHGLPFIRLPTAGLSRLGWQKRAFRRLTALRPDLAVWNFGLTSLLQAGWEKEAEGCLSIAVFTSPLYSLPELLRIGPLKLLGGWRLSALHLLGSLVPRSFLRRALQKAPFHRWVTQTETLRRQLTALGLPAEKVRVIPPGVGEAWSKPPAEARRQVRARLGFQPADRVILYFGASSPLRGLPLLLEAFTLARRERSELRLLVLERPASARAERLICRHPFRQDIRLISTWLPPEELARHAACADLAALPFELVPSDAPLSLLEARALGLPLATTRVACLPELAGDGACLAKPSHPLSLAQALLEAVRRSESDPAQAPGFQRRWQDTAEDWLRLIRTL